MYEILFGLKYTEIYWNRDAYEIFVAEKHFEKLYYILRY